MTASPAHAGPILVFAAPHGRCRRENALVPQKGETHFAAVAFIGVPEPPAQKSNDWFVAIAGTAPFGEVLVDARIAIQI